MQTALRGRVARCTHGGSAPQTTQFATLPLRHRQRNSRLRQVLLCLDPALAVHDGRAQIGMMQQMRLMHLQGRLCTVAAAPGILQKLGRVLKEKATGDLDRVFKGTSKTREKLGVRRFGEALHPHAC